MPNCKRAPIDTLNDGGWFSQERAVTLWRGPLADALGSLVCRRSKSSGGLLIESRFRRQLDAGPNPNRLLAR
jgi:hypothetical protein